MTGHDLPAFMEAIQAIERIFPWRGSESEREGMRSSYFQALKDYPIAAIETASDNWVKSGQKFPKPADLIAALPKVGGNSALQPLTAPESSELDYAKGKGYEASPCDCGACGAAGFGSDKPPRYVPQLDRDGAEILRRDTATGFPVTIGRWIHGAELARWYQAKGTFYAKFYAMKGSNTL